MNVGAYFSTAIIIGCIGAAFGSLSASLIQIYTHRRETLAAHRAAQLEFAEFPHSLYSEAKFWAALAAGMTFTLGLVLITGGDARTSAHAYSGIAATGGPVLWGSSFLSVAAFTWLCAWRHTRLLKWALLVQALPFAGIAMVFAIAAVQYPDANLTAAPIYGWIMIMHACLADYARRQY